MYISLIVYILFCFLSAFTAQRRGLRDGRSAPYLNERQRKRRAFADKELDAILFQRENSDGTTSPLPVFPSSPEKTGSAESTTLAAGFIGSIGSHQSYNLDQSNCRFAVEQHSQRVPILSQRNDVKNSCSTSQKNTFFAEEPSTQSLANNNWPHYKNIVPQDFKNSLCTSIPNVSKFPNTRISAANSHYALLMAIIARSSNFRNPVQFLPESANNSEFLFNQMGDQFLPSQLLQLSLVQNIGKNSSSVRPQIESYSMSHFDKALDLSATEASKAQAILLADNNLALDTNNEIESTLGFPRSNILAESPTDYLRAFHSILPSEPRTEQNVSLHYPINIRRTVECSTLENVKCLSIAQNKYAEKKLSLHHNVLENTNSKNTCDSLNNDYKSAFKVVPPTSSLRNSLKSNILGSQAPELQHLLPNTSHNLETAPVSRESSIQSKPISKKSLITFSVDSIIGR